MKSSRAATKSTVQPAAATTDQRSMTARGQNRSRTRSVVIVVLSLATVALAVRQVARYGRAPQLPADLPRIAYDGLDPMVVQAIESEIVEVTLQPRSAEAWGRLGMMYQAHFYNGPAALAYAKASELDPKDGRWPYLRAAATYDENPELSIPLLRQAIPLLGDRYPTAQLRLAAVLIEQGQVEEAEPHLARVRAVHPNNARCYELLGQVALARGATEQAREMLERSIALDPNVRPVYVMIANTYNRLGQPEKASQALAKAAALPENRVIPDELVEIMAERRTGETAWINRAETWMEQGNFPKALQLLEAIVTDYPQSYRGWMYIGIISQINGNLNRSRDALNRARELKPDIDELAVMQAYTLLRMGRLDDAEQVVRDLLAKWPDLGEGHMVMGMIQHRRRNYPAAIESLRTAVKYRPDYGNAHGALAKALLAAGHRDEATAVARDALKLDPANVSATEVIRDTTGVAPDRSSAPTTAAVGLGNR